TTSILLRMPRAGLCLPASSGKPQGCDIRHDKARSSTCKTRGRLTKGGRSSDREGGVIGAPAPGPFADQESNAVHEADIADVAAVALLHDGHEGHAYEVNGPETLTRAEQAQVIGTAIGRDDRS